MQIPLSWYVILTNHLSRVCLIHHYPKTLGQKVMEVHLRRFLLPKNLLSSVMSILLKILQIQMRAGKGEDTIPLRATWTIVRKMVSLNLLPKEIILKHPVKTARMKMQIDIGHHLVQEAEAEVEEEEHFITTAHAYVLPLS